MKMVVIGAGAVGGYFGARLAKAGSNVQFLVREGRFAQLRKRGLQVQSTHGDFELTPDITTSVEEAAADADLVILSVKGYHLDALMPSLHRFVEHGADILPLLNGVSHFETLRKELGSEHVLGGVCYIESTLNKEGDVIHTSPMHDIVWGPMPGDEAHAPGGKQRDRLEQAQKLFEQAGFQSTLTDNVVPEVWKKFLFLTAFSGVTAASRGPIGKVLQDEPARHLLESLLEEGAAVAKARGAQVPDNLVDQVLGRLMNVPPTMTSSLHRDIEKGQPIEIDTLQGAWVDMGREAGVPTPAFGVIYALLHPYRDGR